MGVFNQLYGLGKKAVKEVKAANAAPAAPAKKSTITPGVSSRKASNVRNPNLVPVVGRGVVQAATRGRRMATD